MDRYPPCSTHAVPTSIHEIPLALLDERPSMLLELLRAIGGPDLAADDLTPVSETFAQIEPATYSADRVYEARFAGEPIATLHGGVLAPFVIGPGDIPRVALGASAELAVLSTMAHGTGSLGGEIAAVALTAVRDATHLDEARARLYNDVVLFSIDDVARAALEASMDTMGWEWKSDFARHWVGVGVEQGREQGREQGLEQGREQGLERRREEGERRAIRTLCEALGIGWNDEREARLARASLDDLEELLKRIVKARAWVD